MDFISPGGSGGREIDSSLRDLPSARCPLVSSAAEGSDSDRQRKERPGRPACLIITVAVSSRGPVAWGQLSTRIQRKIKRTCRLVLSLWSVSCRGYVTEGSHRQRCSVRRDLSLFLPCLVVDLSLRAAAQGETCHYVSLFRVLSWICR